MKLYITPASPYARMARIVVIDKGLRIESKSFRRRHVLWTARSTRSIHRAVFRISSVTTAPAWRNPLSSAPISISLTVSQSSICRPVTNNGRPVVWKGLSRSMLDGLAVWGREITRPQNEQSPTVIRHEAERSTRMADLWEREIDHPLMHGPLNMVHITLACALDFIARVPDFHWRPGHPKLCEWFAPIAARPSFAATAPPAYH